jgi:hypothetical protein
MILLYLEKFQMNQSKYYLKILILPFLLTFSRSIAITNPYIWWAQQNIWLVQQKKSNKINIINYQINAIKDDLYKKILTELQLITNRPYNYLKEEIDEQRNLTRTLLQQKNHHAQHDPNIPDSITQKLCETISQHNINPNNIDFIYENSSTTTLAGTRGGAMRAGFLILNPKIIKKPDITIYSALLKESGQYQLQTYHHEICHILLQHSHIHRLANKKLPNIILEEATTEPYTASEIYYEKKGISHLASLIEEEADIHASLSSSQMAYIGMQRRCSSYSHVHITEKQNHCKNLTTIYELMKQKEKLSQKNSNY